MPEDQRQGSPADGTEPDRRSLELAISRHLPNQAARAYSNLYGISCDQFRFDEGEQYYRDGLAYREQNDLDQASSFLRATRTIVLEHRGCWDEAVAISAQLLEENSAAPLYQICVQRDALRRLDELGAKATASLARRKLRHIGARSVPAGPRRATRAHPLGLTPRECEVLELICERQTNAQIARTLFISAKTVDHQVSAVLAKLGVENREAAADMGRNLTA